MKEENVSGIHICIVIMDMDKDKELSLLQEEIHLNWEGSNLNIWKIRNEAFTFDISSNESL